MQASKSREDLAHFDTFQCLSCQTLIRELKPPSAGGPAAKIPLKTIANGGRAKRRRRVPDNR